MSDTTVIIIGGGLGGLLTGALLAKEGLRVTVLEQHHQVGGGLQSYTRRGTVFDTGMHIFGGMKPGGNIRRICDYLGITGRFVTKDLDAEHDTEIYVESYGDRYEIDLNADRLVDSLTRYFPRQRAGLEAYKAAILQIMQRFDLFYLRPAKLNTDPCPDFLTAADDFIAKYITDPELQALLATVNVLYAGEPQVSPSFLHAAISMIFLNGACRIAGGYSTFADALMRVIESNGGRVLPSERVDRIVTEGRKVVGVSTADGDEFKADYVVSSIAMPAMLDMIDKPSLLSNSYRTLIASQKPSLSAFIVNIKLKRDSLPFSNRIGFYLRDYSSAWRSYTGGEIEKFMYMTPPLPCQGEYADTLSVTMPMEWNVVEKWAHTNKGCRDAAYAEMKENIYRKILAKLELIYPGIEDMVEMADTCSPLTIRDYTGVINGAMCGVRKDKDASVMSLPVVTRIPNLFITGQHVNMHGFCGVSLTAINTCEAILGKDHLVNKLNKQ